MQPAFDAFWFYLPATLVSLGLYLFMLVWGQEFVLPLDLGLRLKGRPLVGRGRGLPSLAAACLFGAICAVLQGRGDDALVLSLGAHMGTVVNSFLKRRLGRAQGEPFFPADHIDFVLGASLFYQLQYGLDWQTFVLGCLVCGILHWSIGSSIRRRLVAFESV